MDSRAPCRPDQPLRARANGFSAASTASGVRLGCGGFGTGTWRCPPSETCLTGRAAGDLDKKKLGHGPLVSETEGERPAYCFHTASERSSAHFLLRTITCRGQTEKRTSWTGRLERRNLEHLFVEPAQRVLPTKEQKEEGKTIRGWREIYNSENN